jgi:uncharacterized protein (DUF4213/DUF364 family)
MKIFITDIIKRFKKGDKIKTINYLGTKIISNVIEKINANFLMYIMKHMLERL